MRIRLFPLIVLLFLSLGTVAAQQSNCWDGSIAEAYAGGDGTAENPYQIATAEQLALLAQQTNSNTGGDAHYILTNDICLNENLDVNPQTWIPIGRAAGGEPHFFTGQFDGNNKTVSGLYHVDSEGDEAIGLFGCTNGAEIVNVNLSTCRMSGSKYVGTLVGHAGFTYISGCTVNHASITCEMRSAGGLAGFFGLPYGTNEDATETYRIDDCHVNQNVSVFGKISGGLVGEITEYLLWGPSTPCTVSNCSSHALLEGIESVGGIAGFFRNGNMDCCNCWNEVHSSQLAGGLIGCGITVNIYDCLNCADVNGEYYCGGMVGKLYAGNLKHCRNYGRIDGNGLISAIGGIVGKFLPDPLLAGTDYENIVRNCNNYGEITQSADYAGGIIGYSEANAVERLVIVDCCNSGRVHNNFGIAGGIVGYNHSFKMSIFNVYNTGTTGARYCVGGIVGKANSLMSVVMNTYNSGELVHEIDNYVCPRGTIVGMDPVVNQFSSCFWLDNNEYGSNGNGPELENSIAFIPTSSPLTWQLETPMHNTTDLLAALNAGAAQIENEFPLLGEVSRWCEDTEISNGGFPVLCQQFTDIEEQELKEDLVVYPNPTNGLLFVETCRGASLQGTNEFRIVNIMGQTVMTGSIGSDNQQIEVSSLSNGLYFINIGTIALKFIVY